MYTKYIKRLLDFSLSSVAVVCLSPLFALLTIAGSFSMGGNPFFVQERPGKDEKIFKLIKFRTMNNKKGADGNLLPDVQRITKYGDFLRKTSLDELPELINIIIGNMSIVGPRPLLVKYLPLYNEEQKHRHDVRPGLTGYAQVQGRNCITWKERFKLDIFYVNNISLALDTKIIWDTVMLVLKRDGINTDSTSIFTMTEFTGDEDE